MKKTAVQTIDKYRADFNAHLQKKIRAKEPANLYEPMSYIMGMGGKRLRPVLLLLATDAFGGDYKSAMDAALALELFHNFSLVHDDIMDAAPLRRGYKTVHQRWDINTGILSGDAMLIHSYQLFEPYDEKIFKRLVSLFSATAIQLCEGQQYDIDFEAREDVTLAEYLKMITYKTAALVAAAMKMGGIIANTSKESQNKSYDFGLSLGIAFQLQDDYLDTFGDPAIFGKQLGGDIIENKKTYLYLKSMELSDQERSKELEHLFSLKPANSDQKISMVKEIYEKSGAAHHTKEEIKKHTQNAFKLLTDLDIPEEGKSALRKFGENLMHRNV